MFYKDILRWSLLTLTLLDFHLYSEDYKIEKLNNICFIYIIVLIFNLDVKFY